MDQNQFDYQTETRNPKILVAEDNHINQKLFDLLFRKLGYAITVVSNGEEAVEMARSHSWDVIFMDVEMPVMNGVDACNQIKMILGESAPPVIAVTANAIEGDREKYLNQGMDDYIAKPIKLNDLERCISGYSSSIAV